MTDKVLENYLFLTEMILKNIVYEIRKVIVIILNNIRCF